MDTFFLTILYIYQKKPTALKLLIDIRKKKLYIYY